MAAIERQGIKADAGFAVVEVDVSLRVFWGRNKLLPGNIPRNASAAADLVEEKNIFANWEWRGGCRYEVRSSRLQA